MRTAIISDLHLGVASDEDVLRAREVRRALFEEIAGADRVVLLGDVVELRNLPLGPSLERARPFFEELGEALGEAEVTLVPGNHDARLAEPLLDELSIAAEPALGLEHHFAPAARPA
ncbi:MAG TPA: metallophosphoesterase, partial [Solirubrobacterales bacterium]|nr:metallophosphoesterase [Solirubrobacterales bacterium]